MTYDRAGNMLTRKEYDYTTGTLGSVRSTQTYTYGESNWGDRLKSINGTAVTSDVIGNITNDGTWSYIWKNGRQLGGMAKSGTSWLFYYDASGMRTQRTGNGTTYNYTYDGTTLSRMTVGSNTLEFAYGADGLPMAVKYNSTYYYYVTNALGDVTAILNSSGTAVVSYVYDAWGNIISTGGTMASTLGTYNPFRYRSYVYDQETGLYYLQSRYYNPKLCRFISADDPGYLGADGTPVSYNLFAYCGNNPVTGYDPTGTWDWSVFTDIAVTLLSGLAAVCTGVAVNASTGNLFLGIAAGVGAFGIANNAVNAVYYTFISNGISEIEKSGEKSTYVDRYVTRWERLDYTKQQTSETWYSPNAWRYHSEYSLHMYGWYATGWSEGKNIPVFSNWSKSFKKADVDPTSSDPRLFVAILSVLWGIVGL